MLPENPSRTLRCAKNGAPRKRDTLRLREHELPSARPGFDPSFR